MDIILNTVGKDCFGLIMEYAKMKDEFDMCITQIQKSSVVVDMYTCWFHFHMDHYFEDDGYEYYYPYVDDHNPDNSYVEFVYFMDDLKEYKKLDPCNNLSPSIFKTAKMIKKMTAK